MNLFRFRLCRNYLNGSGEIGPAPVSSRELYEKYREIDATVYRIALDQVARQYGIPANLSRDQVVAELYKRREANALYVIGSLAANESVKFRLSKEQFTITQKYMMDNGRHITTPVPNPMRDPKLDDVPADDPAVSFDTAFGPVWEFALRGMMVYQGGIATIPVGYMRLGTLPELVIATIGQGANFPAKLERIPTDKNMPAQQILPIHYRDIQLFEQLPTENDSWGKWLDRSLAEMNRRNNPQRAIL